MVPLQPGRLVGGQREGRGVGLAETETGEGLQHVPDPFHHPRRVATPTSQGHEPVLHVELPRGVAQGPSGLVTLGQAAAGHHGDDLDDLFVEDHHPAGLGQHRFKIRMQVAGR